MVAHSKEYLRRIHSSDLEREEISVLPLEKLLEQLRLNKDYRSLEALGVGSKSSTVKRVGVKRRTQSVT